MDGGGKNGGGEGGGKNSSEDGACQHLDSALAWARSAQGAGLIAVVHLANGTHHVNNSAPELTFDAGTTSSEVRLIGDEDTELRPLDGSQPLLRIASGAPPVTLSGLRLQGQVEVSSAQPVHVERCRFQGGTAVAGGALAILNGSVLVDESVFVENQAQTKGGAIALTGGLLDLRSSTLVRNAAAGAQGGGALHMEGGVAVLKNTLMLDNHAGTMSSSSLQSIFIASGSLEYQLPAPLGRWIASFGESSLVLSSGSVGDYPYNCPAGLFGDSTEVSVQTSPACTGLCPPGRVCPGATVVPEPCSAGGYCPAGSVVAFRECKSNSNPRPM